MRSRWDQMGIPNPGSKEALETGCQCPMLDNHHGRGIQMNNDLVFWIDEHCPMHMMITDVQTDLV